MQITFLGATRTVTGSKHLLTIDGRNFLIDCGLYQGRKELRQRNWSKLPIEANKIEAVILSHAHLDHSGYIPLLIKHGFTGKIYCTRGTKDLCAILLPDSGHIEEEDAKRANKHGYTKHKPALPLYTREEAIKALDFLHPIEFDKTHVLHHNIKFKLMPAGHIIGASLVHLEYHDKTLLFSGDLGRPHPLIMKAPRAVKAADYIVLEATYGDRLHDASNPEDQIADIILQTINNGGSVVIPAFAVGRSQEALYLIYRLKKAGRIPDVPVFLDSPMAQDASELLGTYSHEHQLSYEICKEVCATAQYTRSTDASKSIDEHNEPVIIISASGMCTGGRILHHLKIKLPNPKNTVIFIGYQESSTLGDKLIRGDKEVKIYGELIPVGARIEAMHNMSAHADYQEILQWLENFTYTPRKVFLTHSDLASAEALKSKIAAKFGWECEIPDYMQCEKL